MGWRARGEGDEEGVLPLPERRRRLPGLVAASYYDVKLLSKAAAL
jgi:hypothetical protein